MALESGNVVLHNWIVDTDPDLYSQADSQGVTDILLVQQNEDECFLTSAERQDFSSSLSSLDACSQLQLLYPPTFDSRHTQR